jgi:hypothetical protein
MKVFTLPTMHEGGMAHNMACISKKGLYRRPSNSSVIVHFLKTANALGFVSTLLQTLRAPDATESALVDADENYGQCVNIMCSNLVWAPKASRDVLRRAS